MSDHYYEDSIEPYAFNGDACYQPEPGTFEGSQDVASSPFVDDYYEDIEPELSSPTPLPRSKPRYRYPDHHMETAYRQPKATDFRIAELSHHNREPPVGRLHCLQDPREPLEGTSAHNENLNPYNRNSQSGTDLRHEGHSKYNFQNHNAPMPNKVRPPNPRNSHGIRLRPVSDLPDVYRGLFKFGVFNAVQSKCFNEVVAGDKNLVISAPTGSGKTVLFELGIIRMVEQSKLTGKQVKCVYVAPTKALCSEKFQDWVAKFEPIGLKCCELTGDTVIFGHNTWGDAKNASIIVTTCEKWDSLTRNWHDHEHILSQIQLFLVDEVHILNESRGSTLEVVTSRMKLRGSSIRFILVSATVPNISDVANWIGSGFGKLEAAQVFEFGDDYRPCQLTRHVVGVYRRNGSNDFQFAKVLDCKLFSVLQQFSVGKPILVFCSTRKGVFDTAEQLRKEYSDTESKKASLPWSRPARIEHSFHDKRLHVLACVGIGVHHAGISMDDRRATEQLYLKKVLRILVATSTLAVGVNLPAHMVVIKGVRMFQNNASKEYSDLDIMQMLGRAGRPQFDKDGIAVILCESDLEQKYKVLVQGKTVLESSLHINLAEHLNSEIGLGTITDVESAKSWLRSSFLYQRMQHNPGYYALGFEDSEKHGEVVDDVVMKSIAQLKKTLLINHVDHGRDIGKLSCTQYGEIMSKYYIRRATMDLILALPELPSMRQILESICEAEEFQDVKLRGSEKTLFNTLKKDMEIRFEVKKVEKTADKVFLLVQAVLGGISLNSPEYRNSDSQPHMEAFTVFKHIARISRAALDVAIVKKDGLQIKNGFRCLSAKAWEDRAIVFRQLEQIGEKSIKVLAEHGITSLATLRIQTPLEIETLLNRRHPFGLDVLASVAEFPQYALKVKELAVQSDGGKNPIQVDLIIECGLVEEKAGSLKSKKQRNRTFQMTAVLTLTSDMDLVDVRRIPTKSLKSGKSFEVAVELKKPSQNIIVIITSETIAGVALQRVYKPDIPPSEYPTLDTRPLSSAEMDFARCEDDPDFWANMDLDSSEDRLIAKIEERPQRLTKLEDAKIHPDTAETKFRLEKSDPMTRFDGRYDCNHPCKDKTKCRHLCCRDGLPEPPHASKRKLQNSEKSNSQQSSAQHRSTVQRLHVPSTIASQTQKQSLAIKALDLLHERTQVASNLSLGQGQRLKLESPRPLKRKRRLPVEYDISFTNLGDPELNSMTDIPEAYSDSEELPAAILPVSTLARKAEDNTDYIRSSSQVGSHQLAHSATTGEDFDEEPRSKRMKYRTIPEVPKKAPMKNEEMFLESSDSECSLSIFTPVKAKASYKDPKPGNKKVYGEQTTASPLGRLMPVGRSQTQSSLSATASDFVPSPKPTKDVKMKTEAVSHPSLEEDSEFAELDAWLQSGSVDIL